MDPVSAGFTLDEAKPIFTLAGEPNATTTTDSYAFADTRSVNGNNEPMFSSAVPGFGGTDLLKMLSQQEPRIGDTAPSTPYSSAADMEDLWSNIRLNRAEMSNDDSSANNYFSGYNRLDSASVWSDGVNNTSCNRNNDLMDSFDFLMKSLSSANNYVSMLTREQLYVLRSIRPSLLYELLQEVAKARSDRRMRRALPSECAFCKNNGENEECYSSHSLKDWRGRVLCPVLRAFRCPRCGATGDRAHTIKYCPEGTETGAGAGANLASRRRMPPSSLLLGASGGLPRQVSTPTAPAASPVSSPVNTNLTFSSLWSNFSLN